MIEHLSWLLLIVSLPTNGASARMRIWRALKSLGCAPLRDGAYLLPQTEPCHRALAELVLDAQREGGSAWLVAVQALSPEEEQTFLSLFDRTPGYAELGATLAEARATLVTLTSQEVSRTIRRLRREYDALRAIDYFPNAASDRAETAWREFVHAAESILSPGEPHAVQDDIPPRAPGEYQGRVWATRRRLWVDRVACAWLIRRFIDPAARFLWLESPAECPADALGFDFDGAQFTHVGERVSFEVLLASFALEQDRGLARLGAMVRALDTGQGHVPEAIGFEAILGGARQRAVDDDQLLSETSPVLDALYLHFSGDPQGTPSN